MATNVSARATAFESDGEDIPQPDTPGALLGTHFRPPPGAITLQLGNKAQLQSACADSRGVGTDDSTRGLHQRMSKKQSSNRAPAAHLSADPQLVRIRDTFLSAQRSLVNLPDLLGMAVVGVGAPWLLWDDVNQVALVAWGAILLAGVLSARDTKDEARFRDRAWLWGSCVLWGALPWLALPAMAEPRVHWLLAFVALYGFCSDAIYVPQTFSIRLGRLIAIYGTSFVVAFIVAGEFRPAIVTAVSAGMVLAGSRGWIAILDETVHQRALSEERAAIAKKWRAIDDLTGLGTRMAATTEIGRLKQAGSGSVHCAFIDLDDFKRINDLYGYATGDAAIIASAEAIRAVLPRSDWHLSRFAGDEFVAVGSRPLNPDEVKDLLTFDLLLASPLGTEEHQQSLTIGTTELPAREADADRMFREASDALRSAKQSGKQRLVATTNELRNSVQLRSDLAIELREALAADDIVPFAQTINDLRTGAPVGMELLARWTRKSGEIIAPDVFIPIIESTGLGAELGRQMVHHAINSLAEITAAGDDKTYVTLNLSAHSLYQRTLPEELQMLLADTNFAPQRLVLEITESQELNENSPVWTATARRLREQGVSLAIDDFGTGYSSISQLIKLPFTHLKVDRTLTLESSVEMAKDLCAYLAAFADKNDLTSIVEGIETEAERDFMLHCGYETGQGYLFHRPEPLHTVIKDSVLKHGVRKDSTQLALTGDSELNAAAGEPQWSI